MKKYIYIALLLLLILAPVSVHGGVAITGAAAGMQTETMAYFRLAGASGSQSTLNTNIRAIKYSSGVTLSSITGKIAITDPGFLTGLSVDLRWISFISGATISLTDGTNAMTALVTGAGTGAVWVATPNALTNTDFAAWTGDNPDGWTISAVETAGRYVTENPAGNCKMVSDGTAEFKIQQGSYGTGQLTRLALHKITVDVTAYASGNFQINDQGYNVITTYTTTGSKTVYWTGVASVGNSPNALQFGFDNAASGDVTIDNPLVLKGTAPDTTGFTFGTIVQGSFNPNTFNATGGNLTITRP